MTEKTYKGLVGFSRITGNKKLYMSNLNNTNWITLRVYEGKDDESYGEKRTYTKSNRPLLELDLSAAQFAELLTTMNVGNGVPCTLKSFDGKRIDQTALDDDEKPVDVGKRYFEDSAKEFTETLIKRTTSFKKDLEKMRMAKKDKARIEIILNSVETEVLSNMPFYVSMFEEAAKKVVTESKSEIDAFVTGGIVKAGLEALGINDKLLLDK